MKQETRMDEMKVIVMPNSKKLFVIESITTREEGSSLLKAVCNG